jgi:hypothetical protein
MRIATTAALMLACVLASAAAAAEVPRSWIGTYAHSPLLERGGALESEHAEMAAAGVGTVRSVFDWRSAQPHSRLSRVPEADRHRFRTERGGIPTDWSEIDRQVSAAARNRLRMLPIVIFAPPWASLRPGDRTVPKGSGPYARFVASLSLRYGPRGRFWDEHPELPRVPLRDWQVWNEPNFFDYWQKQPFQRRYIALLRRTRIELRRVDRGARIVLAGFANDSWQALESLYRRGARRYFDAAAVHPFTATVDGVVEIVRRNRAVMRRYGDRRKPILVTELTWTSGNQGHGSGVTTTEQGQAEKVTQAFEALAGERRRLGIGGVFWLSWLSTDSGDDDIFHWSGLSRLTRDNTIERKPAYFSFRDVAARLTGR